MVLDDIADGAGALVEPAPVAHSDGLGHGYLHVVHPRPVPHGFEDRRGETKGQEVLDRLLGQIMVYAEDLLLVEGHGDLCVQRPGTLLVPAEGLLDHQPGESSGRAPTQPGRSQQPRDDAEQLRRSGQIEQPVAAGTRNVVTLLQQFGQRLVGRGILVAAGHIPGLRKQPLPALGSSRPSLVPPEPAELGVGHVRPSHPDQDELQGQAAFRREPAQRRQELAPREVAGCAEDD